MRARSDAVSPLEEGLLIAASDAIRERLGLSFRRERWRELEAGLNRAAPALGLEDAAECARWVMAPAVEEAQLRLLAQSLTVGETHFCRDAGVFHAFEQEILPPLVALRRTRDRRLRVWSAACCTGEEPYTIAMLLRRAIPDLDDWNLTILATDVNGEFLARAEEGVFGEWSFRRTPAWMRRRHFRRLDDGRWQIDSDIRRLVTFAFLNLADPSYPSLLSNTNAMDIVFCRNVLMYFDPPLVEAVGQRLQASLLDGGWLAVGRSESLARRDAGLNLRKVGGENWYRKEPAAPQRDAVGTPKGVAATPRAANVLAFPVEAERLYAIADYAAVCDVLRAYVESGAAAGAERRRAMRLLAHASANLGCLDEAQGWCERAIAEDKLDARLHYLLASVLLERDRMAEAATSFRDALTVDENFVLAHFALGNLARRQSAPGVARDHYERALALLRRYRPDDVLPESDGMTARNLSDVAGLALAQC